MPEIDDGSRVLIAEVELGLEVESFLRSKVGRYLLGRAEIEKRDAYEAIAKVDPEDAKAVRDVQNRLWLAEHFEQWVSDAVLNGRNAEAQIHHNEAEQGD